MATQDQIESFHQFAITQLSNGGANLTMDELYSLWRIRNPTTRELRQSVAAVQAAIEDLEAGDSGESARQALQATCARLGLVIDG